MLTKIMQEQLIEGVRAAEDFDMNHWQKCIAGVAVSLAGYDFDNVDDYECRGEDDEVHDIENVARELVTANWRLFRVTQWGYLRDNYEEAIEAGDDGKDVAIAAIITFWED